MILGSKWAGPIALALLLGLGQAACNTRMPGAGDAAPAPMYSAMVQRTRDTPPASAAPETPAAQAGKTGGLKVSRLEYEGWRQYSVNCARCHGQDVLPNPVAANLLLSLGPKGPIKSYEEFAAIVTAGRPASGMPAFKDLAPEQIRATYAYVKGRADRRIPPGRPDKPEA